MICVHAHVYTYRGESLSVQSDNVSASAWMDRKIVMAMYNSCDPTHTSTVMRRKKDGTREPVTCPEALKRYNQCMGGVDLGDQLRGYYHVRMKSRKVYKYIANFLFDVSITNGFILYKVGHPGSKMRIKEFRVILAKDLTEDYCSKRSSGRKRGKKRLPLTHFPIKNEERKRGRCSFCSDKKKKRTDTQWFCRECDVWLCHQGNAEDCFLRWHS